MSKSIARVLIGIALAIATGVLLVSILNQLAGLPDNSGRKFSQVIDSNADSSLGRRFAPELAENSEKNGIIELPHGRDA